MDIKVFEHDLPTELVDYFCNEDYIGVDVETSAVDDDGNLLSYKDRTAGMRGLEPATSRLSLIQLGDEKGEVVVFVKKPTKESVNLKKVLTYDRNMKIMHYAIFDNTFVYSKLGYHCINLFCTRTLAKMVIPPGESSSLRHLVKNFFGDDFKFKDGIEFIFSIHNWEDDLTDEQINYAAKDVAVLGKLKDKLISMATDVQLKYLESAMRLIPPVLEEHRQGIFLKLGMLNVDDLYGTARKWGDKGRSA